MSAAETAYVMIAHGYEEAPHTDVVPDGCTLVIKAGPCEPTYTDFARFIKDSRHEKYLDPEKYIDQITQRYGPVAIFKEGDVYPNLVYKLIGYHREKGDIRYMMSSGIIEYPFYYGSKTFRNIQLVGGKVDALKVLTQYFQHSIYPIQDDVEGYIKEYANKSNDKKITVDEFVKVSDKDKKFTITQRELFDLVQDGMLQPGVFYSFSCRDIESLKNVMIGKYETGQKAILPERRLEFFQTTDNPRRLAHLEELNASVSRQMMRGSLLEPILRSRLHGAYTQNSNTPTRRVLKQHISEAHMHRRPYIKEVYNRKQLTASGSSSGGGGSIAKRKSRKQKKNT